MTGQIVPVIMCGGAGTRLWPVSRESMPKQFVPLVGQASTFQQVLARITDSELFARPIVITKADFRFVVAERMGTIILSALVAHTAWHWMIERYAVFSQYQIRWQFLDAAPLAKALRLAMLIVIAAGLVWLVFGLLWPRFARPEEEPVVPTRTS